MATSQALQPTPFGAGGIPLTQKRESLWQDAMRRLVRNRAAVIGGIIILLLILITIFADRIALKPFDVQVLPDQNKVPSWMIRAFPGMAGYAKVSEAYP